MDPISVIIPWRSDQGWRKKIFDWVVVRYTTILPEAELVLCDDGTPEFTRGRSINQGFEQATSDIVLIADADTTTTRENLEAAVERVKGGAPWVVAYSTYWNLDKGTTKRLLAQPAECGIQEQTLTWDHRLTEGTFRVPISGLVVLSKEAFAAVGGYPSAFTAWGGEDDAFAAALNTLVGHYQRTDGSAYHLFHPRGLDFRQPHWPQNEQLMKRYQAAAGDARAMRALIDSQPSRLAEPVQP